MQEPVRAFGVHGRRVRGTSCDRGPRPLRQADPMRPSPVEAPSTYGGLHHGHRVF